MSPDDTTVFLEKAPASLRRGELRRFAAQLSARVAGGRPFACVVTSDAEVRRLNRTFLRHDYPTDVLSFPSDSPKGSLGDIAISIDRARDQARRFKHATAVEIRILMLHGILHLLGFDHETDNGRMQKAEARWRRAFSLPLGLIERTSSGDSL